MEDQVQSEIERKQLFKEKLIANSQRNARREYLATLAPELGHYLSGCEYLGPKEHKQVINLFDIRPDGIGKKGDRPKDYKFQKFGWSEKALAATQTLDTRHDEAPRFFWIYGPNPIYNVRFGWVRENLPALCGSPMGVITSDRSAGIVISEYCGCLEEAPNLDEQVYELAVWGYGH